MKKTKNKKKLINSALHIIYLVPVNEKIYTRVPPCRVEEKFVFVSVTIFFHFILLPFFSLLFSVVSYFFKPLGQLPPFLLLLLRQV